MDRETHSATIQSVIADIADIATGCYAVPLDQWRERKNKWRADRWFGNRPGGWSLILRCRARLFRMEADPATPEDHAYSVWENHQRLLAMWGEPPREYAEDFLADQVKLYSFIAEEPQIEWPELAAHDAARVTAAREVWRRYYGQ